MDAALLRKHLKIYNFTITNTITFAYLDSLMAELFSEFFLFSSILAIFKGEKEGQSWTKHANFGYLLFRKKLNFSKIL